MDLFQQESVDLKRLKDKTTFKCEECQKEYNSIQGFVSHNNNVHKGEKIWMWWLWKAFYFKRIHMREQHSADIYNIFWAASFLTLAFVWARGSPSLQLSGDWREHLTSTANLSLQKCHTPCGCHWIVTVWHPRPLGWPCPCIYPGPCTEVRTVPSHVSRAELNESRHHTIVCGVILHMREQLQRWHL